LPASRAPLYFISSHLPDWNRQCGIADYGPWITKSHAVRFFSMGQKYHNFSKNLRTQSIRDQQKQNYWIWMGRKIDVTIPPECCQRCIKQNDRHFKYLLYYNTLYISISVFLFSSSVLLLFPHPSNATFERPVYCSIMRWIIKQIFLLK